MELGNYYIAPPDKSFRMFDNISNNQYQYHTDCEQYFNNDYRTKISKQYKCTICEKDLSILENVTSVSFGYPCKDGLSRNGTNKHHCFLMVCSKECGDELKRTPESTVDGLICKTCEKGFERLKYCSKCMEMLYCSRECQVKDWSSHKKKCFKRPDKSMMPPCKLQVRLAPNKIINKD